MSRSSGGLSLKGGQQWFGSFRASYSGVSDQKAAELAVAPAVCVKSPCCGGRLSCWGFAKRRDAITCSFLSLSVAAFRWLLLCLRFSVWVGGVGVEGGQGGASLMLM